MSSNKEPRGQHTVPSCYLANFSVNGNMSRDSMLYFYNTQENKTGEDIAGNLTIVNNFYDIPEFDEKRKIIENAFSKIEGELATQLRDLLGSIILEPKERQGTSVKIDKELIAGQLALLLTRTQAYRNRYKNIYKQMKDSLPYADIPEYLKQDFQRLHTSALLNCEDSTAYANLFNDWHWMLIINHTETPFITSDNPIIGINHGTNETVSMASPDMTYFIPLSPTIAIEIYHKDILKKDLLFFDVNEVKYIIAYNKKIIENCTRFLYSNKSFDALEQARDKINDQT